MAKVFVRFQRPPGTNVAAFKAAQAVAATAMLQHWHTTYVPLHFTRQAYKRYGYQPRAGQNEPPRIQRQDGKPGTRRNPKYYWYKWALKRHDDPLVFSGESRASATASHGFDIRQMSTNLFRGHFVAMPDYWFKYQKPGVFWRRHVYGGYQPVVVKVQPNKAEELTRVTPAELEDMARVGDRRMLQQMLSHYRPPTSGAA